MWKRYDTPKPLVTLDQRLFPVQSSSGHSTQYPREQPAAQSSDPQDVQRAHEDIYPLVCIPRESHIQRDVVSLTEKHQASNREEGTGRRTEHPEYRVDERDTHAPQTAQKQHRVHEQFLSEQVSCY
ncbi:MAG: hypothetical protein V4480_03825 [Patescibacteria group bacterium]